MSSNANHDNSREYSNLDEPHDDDDNHSPVELLISTTVQVEGDNNAILLTASPSAQAKVIAEAVTATVRQACGMNGGIPMIDEEGRPRPFRISVSAGINIDGSRNVLGNADHIMRFLGGKRKRDDGGDGQDADEAIADKGGDGDARPPPRRPRRSSF